MSIQFIENQTFEKVTSLTKGEYDTCRFLHCDFSEADFSEFQFSDCEFIDCNLSLVKLMKTAMRDVQFSDCKMLGLRFDDCHKFGLMLRFKQCMLNHTSFYQVNLKKIIFKGCKLIEVDFTETDLTASTFDECDLAGATFSYTILEKADLRTAQNYTIDPEQNRIKKTKFSLQGIHGLLQKYSIEIHT